MWYTVKIKFIGGGKNIIERLKKASKESNIFRFLYFPNELKDNNEVKELDNYLFIGWDDDKDKEAKKILYEQRIFLSSNEGWKFTDEQMEEYKRRFHQNKQNLIRRELVIGDKIRIINPESSFRDWVGEVIDVLDNNNIKVSIKLLGSNYEEIMSNDSVELFN